MNSAEKMGTAWFQLLKAYLRLFSLELKLAKGSVVPLILSLCFFMILTIATWGILIILLEYGFYSITHNTFLSLMYTLLFNIVILLLTLFFVIKYFRQMGFRKIRKYLRRQDSALTKSETI